MSEGVVLILGERRRQIDEEGWSFNRDRQRGGDILEKAADCYRQAQNEHAKQPCEWPWDSGWWKPKSRERNLIRAGALYVAAADVVEVLGYAAHAELLLNNMRECAKELDVLLTNK